MRSAATQTTRAEMMPPSHYDWVDMLPFLLFLPIIAMIWASPTRINHDCAYVIQCAQLLTMGKLPYVDFIDVNPPLIFYMNMLPVYAAALTGVTLAQAFSSFVTGQLAVSTLFLWYLFRLKTLNLQPYARFALLLSWMLFSVFVYGSGDFGQRDYLVILMAFPFILIRIIRYYGDHVPAGLAAVIGFLTGIGLSLKPNFFFIVFVPELIALIHTRKFRLMLTPEWFVATAFVALYGLHFLLLPAIVRSELFDRWLPFFLLYYGTINLNLFEHVVKQPAFLAGAAILFGAAVVAFIIVRRRGTRSLRIEMFIGAFIGSFLSYWIQQKGYSYHSLPAKLSFVLLALFSSFWLYEEVMHRKEHFPARRFIALSPSILIICFLAALAVRTFAGNGTYSMYESFEPYRQAIRAHSVKNDRVLFINTILFPAYPTLVQTDRLPGSRYLTSFPLAGFYYTQNYTAAFSYHNVETMPADEKLFLRELADDIAVNKPAIIFIHDTVPCSAMPAGFNMLTYMHHTHFIDTAMREYAFDTTVLDFAMYLRRADTSIAATGRKQ